MGEDDACRGGLLDLGRTHSPGCFYRWIMDGDEVVGGIAARSSESKFVQVNGHVGYGIRPSARGRGSLLGHWVR